MLTLVAVMLNIILVATGLFQYLKLEWCWAGLGVGIGAANLVVLYFKWTAGALAVLAAVGCLIAIAQGAILGYQAAKTFIDKGTPNPATDAGMWDLIFSGHDFSYAFVYVGAGLSMLVLLAQQRKLAPSAAT